MLQPFIDFDFSTHESMVAENAKLLNIEQAFKGSVMIEADLKKIEEQMAQGGGQPTVLVKSDIVGTSAWPYAVIIL